jgi:hypothetical protein
MLLVRRLPCLTSLAAATSALVLSSARALGCPNCETARVVQASVFDASFWSNLTLLLLPLIVLGVIAAVLYRVGLEQPAKRQRPVADEART